MIPRDPAAHAAHIEATFRHIADTRMAGVPVVNPQLGVAMRGWRQIGDERVGVLVTPWFMNLVFVPLTADPAPRRAGTKAVRRLPSGAYDAVWNHEDAIGGFWSVSLFSPMNEFADMDAAIATADATIDLLFAAADEVEREQVREAMVLPAAPRDVEARLVEPEREPPAEVEPEVRSGAMNRRALFGLSRAEAARP